MLVVMIIFSVVIIILHTIPDTALDGTSVQFLMKIRLFYSHSLCWQREKN